MTPLALGGAERSVRLVLSSNYPVTFGALCVPGPWQLIRIFAQPQQVNPAKYISLSKLGFLSFRCICDLILLFIQPVYFQDRKKQKYPPLPPKDSSTPEVSFFLNDFYCISYYFISLFCPSTGQKSSELLLVTLQIGLKIWSSVEFFFFIFTSYNLFSGFKTR